MYCHLPLTLTQDDLADDGLLDDSEVPDDQRMRVDRLGRGTYVVRTDKDGELPDIHESEVVRRVVAEKMMNMSAFDSLQPAD